MHFVINFLKPNFWACENDEPHYGRPGEWKERVYFSRFFLDPHLPHTRATGTPQRSLLFTEFGATTWPLHRNVFNLQNSQIFFHFPRPPHHQHNIRASAMPQRTRDNVEERRSSLSPFPNSQRLEHTNVPCGCMCCAICATIKNVANPQEDTFVELGVTGPWLLPRLLDAMDPSRLHFVGHVSPPSFAAEAAECNVFDQHDIALPVPGYRTEHDFVALCLPHLRTRWHACMVTAAELLKVRGTLLVAVSQSVLSPKRFVEFLKKIGFVQVVCEPRGDFNLFVGTKSLSPTPSREQSLVLWVNIFQTPELH